MREAYERQASIYAWMLSRLENEPVEVELVLVEIGTETVERLRLEVPAAAVEAGVRRRLGQLIREREEERRLREERHQAADRLVFPYAEPRPGQLEIIERVEHALEEREHLLVEAATGLGKTVAALYPVLRYAQRHDKRVFVLTAKNLQQEMAGHVLRLLNPESAFRSVRLRAKARMCANDQVICHEEYCRYARDYFVKLRSSGVVQRLLETWADVMPDVVYEEAKAAEVCPFEVSLEVAREAQAVVCDYNYVFDPYVALTEFAAGNDLSHVILVIDEAHNLVDRGRGYLSPELTFDRVRRVLDDPGTRGSGAARAHPAAGRASGRAADRDRLLCPAGDHRRRRGRGDAPARAAPSAAAGLRRGVHRAARGAPRDALVPRRRSVRRSLLRAGPLPRRGSGGRRALLLASWSSARAASPASRSCAATPAASSAR